MKKITIEITEKDNKDVAYSIDNKGFSNIEIIGSLQVFLQRYVNQMLNMDLRKTLTNDKEKN